MGRSAGERRVVLTQASGAHTPDIDAYLDGGGYSLLRRVVTEMAPSEVISKIERAGLRGRGGGGYPTAAKWSVVAGQKADTKYVVANAYDADPSSPIGQTLVEQNPHRIVESLSIAAFAVGADQGFIYVAGDKPQVWATLQKAIEQARQRRWLGYRIAGSQFSFDVVPARSWGGFIGGEETAALVSIEGRRAMPEQKPPYPAARGLAGKPTLVNSVETLVAVPWILDRGAEAFAALGTDRARGTKLVSLGGCVQNPGLFEVEMGTTIRMIIGAIGGGERDGSTVKAIQVGGPTGAFLPESKWDTPLEYEALSEAGTVLGSGSITVLDSTTCMVGQAQATLAYLASEACGKCVPCRLGTKRIAGILEGIASGLGRPEDLEMLEDLCGTVRDGSLCGFGITAPNPVLSSLQHFREDYRMHIEEGRCPTGACQVTRARRYERKEVL